MEIQNGSSNMATKIIFFKLIFSKISLDFGYFRLYLNIPALFRIPFLLLPPSGTFPLEFLKLWFKFIISNFKNTVSPIFKNVTIIFHCWTPLWIYHSQILSLDLWSATPKNPLNQLSKTNFKKFKIFITILDPPFWISKIWVQIRN